jgi:hypothetical protein
MTKKFRVWDKELAIFAEHAELRDGILEDILLHPKGGFLAIWDNGATKILNENRFVLEQFTGILDSEGKEIYEGDIISGEFYDTEYHCSTTVVHPVVFNNGAFNISSSLWFKPTLKILGNIRQNPKLLA